MLHKIALAGLGLVALVGTANAQSGIGLYAGAEVGIRTGAPGYQGYAPGYPARPGYGGPRRPGYHGGAQPQCKQPGMRYDPSIRMCSSGVIRVEAADYVVPPEVARCPLGQTRKRVERLPNGVSRTWTDRCGRLED